MTEFEDYRTYTQHICVEHQRLNRLLLETRHQLDQWRAAGGKRTPQALVVQLSELQAELRRHFDEEDEEGCVEEAICRCPSLAHDGNELLHEQPSLRAELRQLLDTAERGEEEDIDVAAFVRQFEACCEHLQQHEAAESQVVRQAFSASLDTDSGNGVH